MGCIGTKNKNATTVSSPTLKPVVKLHNPAMEKSNYTKIKIQDAIKKEDVILLEKSLKNYNFNMENLNPGEINSTIFHLIAEHNFAAGMSLLLDYFNSNDKNTPKLIKYLNFKDYLGYTPIMTCIIKNSFETLEILLQQEGIDLSIKNNDGKTASEMATESEYPLAHLFLHNGQGDKSGGNGSNHYIQNSPKGSLIKLTSREEAGLMSKGNGSNGLNKGSSIILRSLSVIGKEKNDAIDPNKKLAQILNMMKDSNTVYVDDEFPRDVYSNIAEADVELFNKKYPNSKWLRAHEILGCETGLLKLFNQIELNDVKESPLYGCDFYSALACMTEYPSRLLKVFSSKEANKHGAYSVNLSVSGMPFEIMLDDYFPCKKNGKPIYSFSKSQELWFMLLEKAFAKLFGNFFELKNIYISEAMEMLSGMPSTQQSLGVISEDDLWNKMLEHDKRNHIMAAGNYDKNGSKGNRIFTIASLYDSESYRIIKLKNPWEDFQWRIGKFCEFSPAWTPELKQEIGYLQGDKTSFYMTISEFRENFDMMSVCHYQENWIRNRIELVTKHNQSAYFELTVDREMEIFISVHQPLPNFMTESPEYDLAPIQLIVAEVIDNNRLVLISSGQKDALIGKPTVYANEDIKMKLSEGKYIIKAKVQWLGGESNEFTLNTLSSHAVLLKDMKRNKYEKFLEQILLDAGKKNTVKYTFSKDCEFTSGWVGAHLYFYASNPSKNFTWTLEIIFEKLENLKLGKNYKSDDMTLKMVIPPGKTAVSWAKRISNEAIRIKWAFVHQWDENNVL